jgi:ABC-type transporter Mla subunit MlaD
MALAQNYIRMHTGGWFEPIEPARATNRGRLNYDRIHQDAVDEAQTIKKERKEVVNLNEHMAEITADIEQKIRQITAELSEKIRNLSDERDLEVKGLKEMVAKLETHIKNASHGGDEALPESVQEKYEVRLNG